MAGIGGHCETAGRVPLTKLVQSESPTVAQVRHAASCVQQTPSVVLAVVAGALLASLPAPAAAAMPGFYPYPSGDPMHYDPYPNPIARPAPIRPAPRPELKSGLKPEPAKDFGAMPKGPLQIVVSIADQHVTLYSNGVRVAQGPVSTGVPGRPTPTGVFSIIQKDRFHHSNLYSNAPMPYMERITWSGVALHEGPLPGYPASHGCIRMTHDFAARLWQVARLGVRVIVARNDVLPADFAHPSLFQPKLKPAEPPAAGGDPEKRVESTALVYVAQTSINGPETGSDQAIAGAGTPPEVAAPGAAAPPAADALRGALADPPKPAPDAADPDKSVPAPVPAKARAANQPVKHAGTVAMFISRKEKKLYVRQGFAPLFEVPVEIQHPEQPLGTHVFTALGFADNGAQMRWNVMTVASEPPRQLISPKIGRKVPAVAGAPEEHLPQTAAQALDRIQIPQEAVDRIGEILSSGASLVISDQGLGPETGEGTDFIVLTR
jgi:lipoprotein-anchoring transpeptidase ErfK/SrfK